MTGSRHSAPSALDLATIERELAAGRRMIAQWASPPEDRKLLRAVDALCARYGALLEVRFYGCYRDKGRLDARLLEQLPSVRRLSLDCLRTIDNVEVLFGLAHLENLHFGVFDIPDGGFLAGLPLERLTRISLVENRRRNFDLAPLARCTAARQVFIQGHTKGIAALAGLQAVRELGLSGIPKKQPLAFVNAMRGLEQLMVILGSRAGLAELAHPTLAKLDVIWVRGLESLGDLARFPALRELVVEDQLRIAAIDLAGAPIERLRITNCKTLARLDGLDALDRIEWLHLSRTALELAPLRDRAWPATTRAVGLFSGSRKWNEATRMALAARGIAQFPHETA